MRSTCRLAAFIATLVASATSARAATLLSPPMSGGSGHLVACRVTNAGTAPRQMSLQMLQSDGSIAQATTPRS